MRASDPMRPGRGSRRSSAGPDRAALLRRAALWCCGLAVGAALSGCAYYNTFYYAKKYYRQAEQMVENAGSDKLPPEAAKKFEESIKQSGKVIKFHGSSRWVDDALYLMGAAYYGKRDYEEALRKFDELVTNYPDSPFVPWALYRSGLCHYERKNYEQMGSYFHRVREGYPKFERRDDLLFIEARSAEDQRQRPEAIRLYRELVREFPKSVRSPEGLRRIGDLYFDAGQADSAYASFAEMGRLSREEATWRQAQLKSADALIRLDRAPEAIGLLEELLPHEAVSAQTRPTEVWPAEVHLGLARAYNAADQPLDALVSLRTVTGVYTNSSFVPEAQFQIGYTYETYLDSLDAARAAYDQVARVGASSVYKEQAAQRSRNLQQLQSLRTQAETDSTSDADRAAGAQLRIAELYLLSQNKPVEAMEKYRQILEQYPESRIAPRAAYAVAWMRLRRIEGARDSALAEFAELVHRFPSSPAARGAIDLLAAEGADTSGLAQVLVELVPDTTDAPPPPAPPGAEDEPQISTSPDSLPDGLASPPPGGASPRTDGFSPDDPNLSPRELMEQAGRGRGPSGRRPETPGMPDSLRRWLAGDSTGAPPSKSPRRDQRRIRRTYRRTYRRRNRRRNRRRDRELVRQTGATAPATASLARVLENRPRARDLHEIILLAPAGWGAARAGQFVQLDCPPRSHFGFRRPFSLAGWRPVADGEELRIVYGVVGTRTRALAQVEAGAVLGVLGPLGRPFRLVPGRRPIAVGGGRGIAPMLMLARQCASEAGEAGEAGPGDAARAGLLLHGARTAELLLPIEEGPWPRLCATDDGSFGFAGHLIALLDALQREGRIDATRDALYACGPNGMLAALSRWAEAHGCPCQVSLETHFGCGLGICAGCAVPVRPHPAGLGGSAAASDAGGAGESAAGASGDAFDRYVFACREGPVFESWRVEWEGVAE